MFSFFKNREPKTTENETTYQKSNIQNPTIPEAKYSERNDDDDNDDDATAATTMAMMTMMMVVMITAMMMVTVNTAMRTCFCFASSCEDL